jgi:hypothetical protein
MRPKLSEVLLIPLKKDINMKQTITDSVSIAKKHKIKLEISVDF